MLLRPSPYVVCNTGGTIEIVDVTIITAVIPMKGGKFYEMTQTDHGMMKISAISPACAAAVAKRLVELEKYTNDPENTPERLAQRVVEIVRGSKHERYDNLPSFGDDEHPNG